MTENTPVGTRQAGDWDSPSHIHALVLIGMAISGIYLCFRLAEPFLPALAWALALAVLVTPFQKWLETKLKRSGLAAAISVTLLGLIVAVPATFVGQRLAQEAAKGAEIVKLKVESGEWKQAIEARPRIASIFNWIERQVDLPGTVNSLASWLTTTSGSIVKGSVLQAAIFCLTFYLLFFFLRDRHVALQSLRSLAPLSHDEMDRLFKRVGDTIYATIYGTLAVSTVQGLMGGLMFWWLGLPAPLLWGVVMALLSMVPMIGAFVVWLPVAFFLAVDGSWGKALTLALWGLIVVGGIDNLLRPILVGNRLKLHTILAFISVVGGLLLFGPSGLIMGPIVLAATMVLLEIWRGRTAAETTEHSNYTPLSGFSPAGAASLPCASSTAILKQNVKRIKPRPMR